MTMASSFPVAVDKAMKLILTCQRERDRDRVLWRRAVQPKLSTNYLTSAILNLSAGRLDSGSD
jgi:hypothetical protein